MSEDRSSGGGFILGGPLLVGLALGAGVGTLICKLGGINYACLMRKIKLFFCDGGKKKCAAVAASAVVAKTPPPPPPEPPAPPAPPSTDDFPKKPCKKKT